MGRPGSFSANFDPALLDSFRDLCKRQGKQYTKVLEHLAREYLESDGQILSVPPPGAAGRSGSDETDSEVLKHILQRLEQLESNDQETEDSIRVLFDRLIVLEKHFQSKSKV